MFEQIKQYYFQLAGVNAEDWKIAEERLKIIHLKKGECLVKENQVCRYVAFINQGMMRMYYAGEQREITTGFVVDGEYISEYESFLTQQPSKYYIEAFEDSELLVFTYEDLQYLYQQKLVYSEVGRKIAEKLFIMISQQVSAMMMYSAEERYLQLVQTNSPLLQRIPQYMLASYLGITPEHLSRIRKKISGNNG